MLQRVQTIFLLCCLVICLLLHYTPVYELVPVVNNADPAAVNPTFTIFKSAILVMLNAGVGVLTLVSIFLYKRRNLQIRLVNLNLLLTLILLGLMFFAADTMSQTNEMKVQYKYGIYLPIVQVVFFFLAARFIKRDEDLVRSADRLR